MKYLGTLKKVLLYVSIAVLLLIIGLAVSSDDADNKYADYTSYNTDEYGVKALYLLAGKMGYDTEVYKRPARFIPDGSTLVVIKPDWYTYIDELEKKYLKEWTARGNTLVFIDDDNSSCSEIIEILGAGEPNYVDSYEDWELYNVGKGKLYINPLSEDFTNEGLKTLTGGVSFIHILDNAENKKVLFNEYYHGMGTFGATIWDIIGKTGVFTVIQLFIGLGVFAYVISRRFGKPVTVFETVKRKENENIYALSNIYAKAKADALVLENILGKFEKELSKFLGFDTNPGKQELITASAASKFLTEMNLKGLLDRCEQHIRSGGGNFNELVFLVQWIEKIRREII
jgi:hypothetical protein